LESTPLTGTEGALTPFFSPDGQWIGFFADGKLKKVPVQGGPVRTLAEAPIGFGASWAANSIVFAPANGSMLLQVSADGGTPSAVTELDTARGEFSHRWPDLLPDGSAVLFTTGTEGSWDDAEIVVQPLGGGVRHVLVHGGSNPRFVHGGRLAYMRGGTIFLASLDDRNWRLKSEAVPVLDGVAHSLDGAAQFSVSRSGGLFYLPGADDETRTLVWVDRHGTIEPVAAPPQAYSMARLSPDGRMIAVAIAGGTGEDIWTYDVARNALSQLTYDTGSDPVWSGDGSRIIFSAVREGSSDLFWKGTERSAVEERLTRSPLRKIPQSVSADGSTLAFVKEGESTGRDIDFLTFDDRNVRPFLNTAANERSVAFSLDGRWIAYVSDAGGRNEVFVASRTDPAKTVQVSAGGGTEPLWRRDSAELFYRVADRMMAVVVRTNHAVDRPRELFRGQFQTGLGGRAAYDVSADGARFLMIKSPEAEPPPRELRVVLGWSAIVQRMGGSASR
jgi:serine/threonine-protein kinase